MSNQEIESIKRNIMKLKRMHKKNEEETNNIATEIKAIDIRDSEYAKKYEEKENDSSKPTFEKHRLRDPRHENMDKDNAKINRFKQALNKHKHKENDKGSIVHDKLDNINNINKEKTATKQNSFRNRARR